jgi:UDP:flavonoid glycosyltransferase YjiC (YdhE family)
LEALGARSGTPNAVINAPFAATLAHLGSHANGRLLTRTLSGTVAGRAATEPSGRVRRPDAESPWLNLAFTAQAYVPHPIDPAIQLVGAPFDPTHPTPRGDEVPFAWERLEPRKRVYCSFGSQAFFQPRLFRRVFAAARALDLQLIASVGDLLDDPDFVREAPEGAILEHRSP